MRDNQKKPLNVEIGKRCQDARESSGFTQQELAEMLNLSVQFISDMERGVSGMSIETVINLCKVLCVSSDYILMGKKSDDPSQLSAKDKASLSLMIPILRKIIEQ